jgi:hypothetical protein
MLKHISTICLTALLFLAPIGCTQHKVEVAPVEIKPIHITIDVNIRMQKALDDFFDEIDAAEESLDPSVSKDASGTGNNRPTP